MGQYIGARYVPRFMGTFDPTQAYENLDVVDNGLGTSYISKTMTPPGTSLTDTTYWALYGTSNGAIINLQNQIGDLSDLTTTDQSNLVNAINEHDTEIQALTNRATSIEGKNSPKNRHIVIVGDSYADTSPTDYAYLIRAANIFKQVDIVAGGGWGFTGKDGAGSGTTGPTLEWLTHFTTFINGLTDDQKADIDDVYIIGGFNDHYSTQATIASHISAFFTYANAALPNAKYHVALCAWCKDGTITTPQGSFNGYSIRGAIVNNVLPKYMEVVNYGAEFMGHFIYELHDYINDYDATDYHPSTTASSKIANALLSAILGKSFDIDVTHPQFFKRLNSEEQFFAFRRNGNNLHFMPILPDRSISFQSNSAITIGNNCPIDEAYLAVSDSYNWLATRGGSIRAGLKAMIRKAASGEPFMPCDIGIAQNGTALTILCVPININTTDTYQIYFLESDICMLDC